MKPDGIVFYRSAQWAGMIPMRISTGFPISQRPIPYWSGWQIPGLFEKIMHFWITGEGRVVWIFFCLIRPDGFMKKQWRILWYRKS